MDGRKKSILRDLSIVTEGWKAVIEFFDSNPANERSSCPVEAPNKSI